MADKNFNNSNNGGSKKNDGVDALLYNLAGLHPNAVRYFIPIKDAETMLENIAKAAFGQVAAVSFQVLIDEHSTTFDRKTKRSVPEAKVIPVVFLDERSHHISSKSAESNIMLGDEQVTEFSDDYKTFVKAYCNIESKGKKDKHTSYAAPLHKSERFKRGNRSHVAIELNPGKLFAGVFDAEGTSYKAVHNTNAPNTFVTTNVIWVNSARKEKGIRGFEVIKEFMAPSDLSSLKGEKLNMNAGRKRHDDDEDDYRRNRRNRDDIDDIDIDDIDDLDD